MRHRLFVLAFVLCTSAALQAAPQTPPQQPATLPPPAGPPLQKPTPPRQVTPPPISPVLPQQPGPPAALKNIKLDITISDSVGPDGPAKKTLSLLVMNGRNGRIRSTASVHGIINVDAHPLEMSDGRISLNITIEYLPHLPSQQEPNAGLGTLTESLSVLLENNKPTLITQSADPRTDRKVTVEVTAAVLK